MSDQTPTTEIFGKSPRDVLAKAIARAVGKPNWLAFRKAADEALAALGRSGSPEGERDAGVARVVCERLADATRHPKYHGLAHDAGYRVEDDPWEALEAFVSGRLAEYSVVARDCHTDNRKWERIYAEEDIMRLVRGFVAAILSAATPPEQGGAPSGDRPEPHDRRELERAVGLLLHELRGWFPDALHGPETRDLYTIARRVNRMLPEPVPPRAASGSPPQEEPHG